MRPSRTATTTKLSKALCIKGLGARIARCPRFGKPGDPNAIFDGAPARANPGAAHNPFAPVQRVPGDQIARAFAVARDHILIFAVVDNGQNYDFDHWHINRANHVLEEEIYDIEHDFTEELEGIFDSVNGAPMPLREIHRLLTSLVNNMRHIRMVETRYEMEDHYIPWRATNPVRAARLGWH